MGYGVPPHPRLNKESPLRGYQPDIPVTRNRRSAAGMGRLLLYLFKFLRASNPKKFSGSREAPAPSAPLNPSSEYWKTDGSAAAERREV